MAAQKVTKISLAEIYKRVPPNQIQKFLQFRDKNAQYRRRVDKYPEFLPKIDWEYYRNNVRCEYVKMVDEFEKKYEELNKIFDCRHQLDTTSYFKQVDEQRIAVKIEVEAYIVESNKRIKAYEAEIARIKSMIPYDQMTCEEFVIACPDKASLIGCGAEPTFWPHIPEEQTPGPANPWLLEEMHRLLETGEPEPEPVPTQKGEPPPPPSGGGAAPPPSGSGAPPPPSGSAPPPPAGAAASPPQKTTPSTSASATSSKAQVQDAKTVSNELKTAIGEKDAIKMEEGLDKAKKLATEEAKKMGAAADAAKKLTAEEAKKMGAAADAAVKEAKKIAAEEAKKADAIAKEAKKLAAEEAKKADAAVKAATKEAAKAPAKEPSASSPKKPDSPTSPASKRKGPDDKGKK